MKIRAIVKKPGKAGVVKKVSGTVKQMERLCGGEIRWTDFADGSVIFYNAAREKSGKMFNVRIDEKALYGTVVIAGFDGMDFTDVSPILAANLEEKEPCSAATE